MSTKIRNKLLHAINNHCHFKGPTGSIKSVVCGFSKEVLVLSRAECMFCMMDMIRDVIIHDAESCKQFSVLCSALKKGQVNNFYTQWMIDIKTVNQVQKLNIKY